MADRTSKPRALGFAVGRSAALQLLAEDRGTVLVVIASDISSPMA
jgi:hypothetical protein